MSSFSEIAQAERLKQNADKTGSWVVSDASQNEKSPIKDAKSQLEKGRTLFDVGQFSAAAESWELAAISFQREGDLTNQARSLSYLSLAYQNLGDLRRAEKTITDSLNILKQKKEHSAALAVALNTLGNLKLVQGKGQEALKHWQEAEQAYADAGDLVGKTGSQINQAQALQSLGHYRRAQNLLANITQHLRNQPDSVLKMQALESLGVALQMVGNLQESQEILQQSLGISDRLKSPTDNSNILFSLGNTARDLQQNQVALNYYQQAAIKTTNPQVKLKAQLNQLSLYTETSQWTKAQSLLASIKLQLNSLPPSRVSVYAAVNFARSLSQLAQKHGGKATQYQEAARMLARGIKQAETLGDTRAKAYALIKLGGLYFQTQQLDLALQVTEKAQQMAEVMHASDITYQAYWQIGRIRKIQGDAKAAIVAYDLAVKDLKSLRSDLVSINQDIQFSFQESVEPVYRELVDLLLQSKPSTKNLVHARETIEALQLAELDNFFREACLEAKPQQIDQIDKTAAIVYPIILPDRLEVIVAIPGKPLISYKTFLSKTDLNENLNQMRQSLNLAYSNEERLRLYQSLYNWLIRPIESELAKSEVKTLAFVLDGSLRTLPMAALHDGKQFLVEKYNLAISPGMQLLQTRSLKGDNLKVMTAGLSEARQGFKALPAVKTEIKQIISEVPSQLLLNEKFTNTNLEKAVRSKPFSVLHLATHSQFSSRSDDTFILTWDSKIKVKELGELIKSRDENTDRPIELLVLSACQTAKGDDRAILGLAGIAVHSRARSTLATLWAVKDESTAKFMTEFYKHLRQPGVGKAEALRRTQLTFLRDADFSHPFYWAPFVLVGNWL